MLSKVGFPRRSSSRDRCFRDFAGVGISTIVDVLLREEATMPGASEDGGVARQSLRTNVLRLASPNLKSLFDHCYGGHVRKSE